MGNGLKPVIAMDWYKARSMLRDERAVAHVQDLVDKMHQPHNAFHDRYYTYDLIDGRMQYLNGAPVARKDV